MPEEYNPMEWTIKQIQDGLQILDENIKECQRCIDHYEGYMVFVVGTRSEDHDQTEKYKADLCNTKKDLEGCYENIQNLQNELKRRNTVSQFGQNVIKE